MSGETDDDLMLRALVQLTESQKDRIDGLRRVVFDLQAQLQARRDMEVLLAHEVRTPLTVVTGVLEAIQHDLPEETRGDLIRRGLLQAEHLTHVMDDLFAPSEGQGLCFPRARLREARLQDLVRQAVDAVVHRVGDNQIDVDVPALVIATAPSRFVAILVNLLENAAKYGGGGTVELRATIDANHDVRVDVADRGPGLRGADPSALFSAFTRGAHVSEGTSGRGVGLYLVRGLARSLGGDASLDDRPGGGAIARFWVPQRRADDPTVALPAGGAHGEASTRRDTHRV